MEIKPIRAPWKGELTPRERFNRQMHFLPVDRSVNMEFGYWHENFTVWRMFRENGITNNDQADRFFSFDPLVTIGGNTWMSPPFSKKVVEIRENTKIITNEDGLMAEVPLDNHDTIPHFIKSPVVTPDDWAKIKKEHFDIHDPASTSTV